MSMWQPFNEEGRRTMVVAQDAADETGVGDITPDHIVIGVAAEWRSTAARVLAAAGATYEKLMDRAKILSQRSPKKYGDERHFTPSAKHAIELAFMEARKLSHTYIGPEHLLMGIVQEDRRKKVGILAGMGIDYDAIFQALENQLPAGQVLQEGPFIKFDHVQLAMPPGEEGRARGFYAGILGMQELEKPDDLKLRGGVWFSSGSLQLHLGTEEGFRPSKKAHPAFACRDFENFVAQLREKGLDVQEASRLSDGRRRAFIEDPFGNRIELTSS